MDTMATILMEANQNSISPKRLTWQRFTPVISRKKKAVVCHGWMLGNQYCTYTATADSSDMPTRTYRIQ